MVWSVEWNGDFVVGGSHVPGEQEGTQGGEQAFGCIHGPAILTAAAANDNGEFHTAEESLTV